MSYFATFFIGGSTKDIAVGNNSVQNFVAVIHVSYFKYLIGKFAYSTIAVFFAILFLSSFITVKV